MFDVFGGEENTLRQRITCHTSHVTYHTSHVTRHLLGVTQTHIKRGRSRIDCRARVTRDTSPVKHHMSHVITRVNDHCARAFAFGPIFSSLHARHVSHTHASLVTQNVQQLQMRHMSHSCATCHTHASLVTPKRHMSHTIVQQLQARQTAAKRKPTNRHKKP